MLSLETAQTTIISSLTGTGNFKTVKPFLGNEDECFQQSGLTPAIYLLHPSIILFDNLQITVSWEILIKKGHLRTFTDFTGIFDLLASAREALHELAINDRVLLFRKEVQSRFREDPSLIVFRQTYEYQDIFGGV